MTIGNSAPSTSGVTDITIPPAGDHIPRQAGPAEPSYSRLLMAASALPRTADAETVRSLLSQVAAGDLDHLGEAHVVQIIASRTSFRLRDLRLSLQAQKQEAELSVPDEATRLADAVLKRTFGGLLKFSPDRKFWRFTGTHWATMPEVVVRRLLQEEFRRDPSAFGNEPTRQIVDAASSILRDRCAVSADPLSITHDPRPVINLLNGELWLDGAEPDCRPHDPASGLTQVLPIKYDPGATCPKFTAALCDIFAHAAQPDEMTRHILELLGYAIQPVRDLPKIVVLYGGGNNGKTSVLQVMTALVGTEHVYAVSTRDRFTISQLPGRLLYIDDDLRQGVTLDDGLLKKIAEAKILTTRRPHGREPLSFKAIALPVLATNNVPRISDASEGFSRRLMVIPFARRFEKAEIKKGLFEELLVVESAGILNAALAGLTRLRLRGDFAEPEDCLAAKEAFLMQATPLRAFVSERLAPTPGGKIPIGVVYESLRAWCLQNRTPLTIPRNTLKARLEGMGLVVSKSHPGVQHLYEFELREVNENRPDRPG